MIQRQMRLIVVIGLVVSAVAGCHDEPDGKALVTGTIYWNGELLSNGYVSFAPVSGDNPSESGKIANGHFSFYAYPGTNKVRIRATKEAGFDKAMNQPILVQFIPVEYNARTKLSCEVKTAGENTYRFSLAGSDAG